MILLASGVLLWSCAHLLPGAGGSIRARLISRLGEGPYKGLFALTIVASLVMMVMGWRSATFEYLYAPPSWGPWATEVLVFVGLYLLVGVGSPAPSNVKRLVRHPQLTGVATWAGAHLLANGDARSAILFGGIGAWSILAMLFINRRDGAWTKPDPVPASRELRPLAQTIVMYGLLFFVHPYFTGVAPPRPW